MLVERCEILVACSRRSDSGAQVKKKASERAGKKRGETIFPHAPLSERLEQASLRSKHFRRAFCPFEAFFAFWRRKNWGERNIDGSARPNFCAAIKAKSALNVRKALRKRLLRRLGTG